MPSLTMDTAVLFWPRGGSAQVIRYLLHELNSRGLTTRLHAGSLGNAGDPSHAPSFYQDLDLHPYDHNDAMAAFTRGEDPQRASLPFHPSYEDRGTCPDPLFSAVPPANADHLTRAWTRHLTAHRSPSTNLLHLHHLSHLQTAAHAAYPGVPRVTTLHGTELKLIDAMQHRIRLAERTRTSLSQLGHLLHSDNPHRTTEALRLAKTAGLDDDEADQLTTTAWHKWTHSTYWLTRLHRTTAHAGRLVVVSDHDQQLATRLLHLHHAPHVVPNGVDTHTFQHQHLDQTARLAQLRHWLVTDPQGWAPGGTPGSIRYTENDLRRLHDHHGRLRPLLLWTGRFLDFKRIPILLRAFAAARTRLDPAPVLLMWGGYPGECEGDHPADQAAELGIEQDVFFIGWRGHGQLPTGLNCADLMVAPAVNEPFGMVYLEAMACGTPPIATSTGGPARTIIPTGPHATGWLVNPDDTNHLADTLTAAILDTTERRRRGTNGRIHTENTYSWTRTADHYLDIYGHIQPHQYPAAASG
ncbi:glycosyltransferase family 4 protein [Streptomyces sp. NPDC020707]|uniref:glycosyltransferase family 4 protein n=1 Tax=Streptomyces sp. NPDC020707 TaxID=3365084 RepID=UPI00378D411E